MVEVEVGESEKRADSIKARVKKYAKTKTLKLSDGQELKLPDTGRNGSTFPGVCIVQKTIVVGGGGDSRWGKDEIWVQGGKLEGKRRKKKRKRIKMVLNTG